MVQEQAGDCEERGLNLYSLCTTMAREEASKENHDGGAEDAQTTSTYNSPQRILTSGRTLRYSTWSQTGGYFDGDGTVYIRIHDWVLAFSLHWVDNWKPQLIQLRAFLESNGVRSLLFPRKGAWLLVVERAKDVLTTARETIQYCSKKRRELAAVIEYAQNRLTGSQVIEVFNGEVKSGQRIGQLREANLPYTREEGLQLVRLHSAEILSSLTKEQRVDVRKLRFESGLSAQQIAERYKVSPQTIWRVLRRQ